MATHCQHLHIVLSSLHKHSLFVKRSKCSFCRPQIKHLGHIISREGVAADSGKIECMVNCPRPTTLKGLRGFLGLTGYYRRFVKGYGLISRPLTELLKKGNFVWNDVAELAFEQLKKVVTYTHVLILPDFTK
ncbi:uncharacterized protein LOC113331919 [Papaver somniferum]|uniref:uncharacterized protein LOC113331919 n=1 Tax=Papaver somniferum TaxID=3469 RepID=UPI000E6F64F1|nr:uncharacterized protein LOC113331919 [Papaver somniferum]